MFQSRKAGVPISSSRSLWIGCDAAPGFPWRLLELERLLGERGVALVEREVALGEREVALALPGERDVALALLGERDVALSLLGERER